MGTKSSAFRITMLVYTDRDRISHRSGNEQPHRSRICLFRYPQSNLAGVEDLPNFDSYSSVSKDRPCGRVAFDRDRSARPSGARHPSVAPRRTGPPWDHNEAQPHPVDSSGRRGISEYARRPTRPSIHEAIARVRRTCADDRIAQETGAVTDQDETLWTLPATLFSSTGWGRPTLRVCQTLFFLRARPTTDVSVAEIGHRSLRSRESPHAAASSITSSTVPWTLTGSISSTTRFQR